MCHVPTANVHTEVEKRYEIGRSQNSQKRRTRVELLYGRTQHTTAPHTTPYTL